MAMMTTISLKEIQNKMKKGSAKGVPQGSSNTVKGTAVVQSAPVQAIPAASKATLVAQSTPVDAKAVVAAQIMDRVYSQSLGELSQEKRQKMEARIRAKLEAGKKLTPKEMDYLRKYNPVLYAKALRIQLKIKNLEEQLKHAKSKEEVSQIETFAVGSVAKNDPDRKAILAAVNRVMQDFKSSKAYQRLPATIEEGKKARNDWKPQEAEDEEDENEDENEDGRDGKRSNLGFSIDICYSAEHGGYQVQFAHSGSAPSWNMAT